MPNQESPSAAISGSLGRLEAILRQWEHAERHFRGAIALNEQIGARHACSTTRWQAPIVSGCADSDSRSRAVGPRSPAKTTL
jgi:hypothetical protein